MNSLLRRQLKQYGIDELNLDENPGFKKFVDAISKSYENYEEQFGMLQRAMMLSSNELNDANEQLKLDAEKQQEIIQQLKRVIGVLKGADEEELEENSHHNDLSSLIEQQAKEIVHINKKRDQLLKELEHQNTELNEYAHVVSHDLKSPLRSVDALASWLIEDYSEVLDENGRETLGLIRKNVEKMDALITGILEYSTVSKSDHKTYDVDLDLLVRELLTYVDLPNHIQIKIPKKLPIVNGDRHRMQQLFQNLIVNAINYNDKERGVIEIGFNDKINLYEFYVKDNGKGIEAPYLDKIFKAFFKLENNPESIGLGLSIVKRIVELYGGTIRSESELDKGTTFFFTLKK
ncbi:sensor histidine kinase [Ochrovirga pacifica]|uniref:sensor histidine kinase n=1 Tax=Ochrovirga pacifica TaxID=1042376 RepID=UPI0002559DA5|nr:ATP-binding protein [Ochrovirga pacifica]